MNINQLYTEELLKSAQIKSEQFDLSLEAPIFDIVHPQIIKKKIEYANNPEQEVSPISIEGWYFACYKNVSSAKNALPGVKVVKGHPFEVFQALSKELTILDFCELGCAVLSKTPLELTHDSGIHQHLVPIWLKYALSHELWGPAGKWTRFHQQLLMSFKSRDLLSKESGPGIYYLKSEAIKLERFGFKGTLLGDQYILNLPWTFPLSALKKLEKVISEEF
ncbi:MAG: hypothetical protein AB7I27_08535 [Bacteriovoracaceae bacterium]